MNEYKEFLVILLFGIVCYISSLGFVGNAHAEGTGVFVSNDGYIMTNQHVVENSAYYTVEYHGKVYHAEVIAYGKGIDLALLKISSFSSCLPVVQEDIHLLDKLTIAQFNFLNGYDNIENKRELFLIRVYSISDKPFVDVLKTGTVISEYFLSDPVSRHGNSGSPVVNSKNEIVGVVCAVFENAKKNITYASDVLLNRIVVQFKNSNPQINCAIPSRDIKDTLVWIKEV